MISLAGRVLHVVHLSKCTTFSYDIMKHLLESNFGDHLWLALMFFILEIAEHF